MKRLFDLVAGSVGLLVAAPVLLAVAIAVKLASPGPVFYVARRVGRDGRLFGMFKFRTMHQRREQGAVITAPGDARIFPLGRFLRRSKLDELPQLFNVVRGEMSVVGPRPEDPGIVRDHYTDWMRETLAVRPGLTSPGAIFGYFHEDEYLDPQDPEGSYVSGLMPVKLAIERVYVEKVSITYDLVIVAKTIMVIITRLLGIDREPHLPEREQSRRFLERGPAGSTAEYFSSR